MHFSPSFKSSPQCAASPDGRLIATLTIPEILIRSTTTLEIVHAIKLPSELCAPSANIQTLLWSPSSTRILLSTPDQIQVFPAVESLRSRATIRNAVPRHAHIQFGLTDSEVLVFAAFGLKLLVVDLASSRAVEIPSPKFHQRSSVPRTVSFRPPLLSSDDGSSHMALLTRTNGKDLISIHAPHGRQLQRSWVPDTIDAQALAWSPDGQLLLISESPAHGWRLLLYTPDGQLVRSLDATSISDDPDAALRTGIRAFYTSPSTLCYAVSEYSRAVSVLDAATWRRTLGLAHPVTICPSDTLQVWQEQLLNNPDGNQTQPTRTCQRATHEISPSSTSGTSSSASSLSGCSALAFDASSNLLATRLDDAPTTLWIWDLSAAELRAVLLFHHPLEFSWHPSARELLLVVCRDDAGRCVPYIWDPLSNGPAALPVEKFWPGAAGPAGPAGIAPAGKVASKLQVDWVSSPLDDDEAPMILLSDASRARLVAVSDSSQDADSGPAPPAWNLADEDDTKMRDILRGGDDTSSILDDTFSFKHTA